MDTIPGGLHRCPTRIDGADVRFSHTVTGGLCQERQREHYHKCFTCVHKNGFTVPLVSPAAALAKLPETPASEPIRELPRPLPPRAAI